MYKDLRFPVLLVHREVNAASVAGERLRGIVAELEQNALAVVATASLREGRIIAAAQHGLAAILLGLDGEGEQATLAADGSALIRGVRVRAPQLPIFALGEQAGIATAALRALAELEQLRGILYLFEDSVAFLAGQVARAARGYLEQLLPPFFRALVQHTSEANYSWHTPGHGGGVAYRKSPVGQAFLQFFGENTLRADLSVSVPELGSLLDHSGPLAEAERRAARNFGADHSFFVINGTSTANKIVWQALVARDDLVLVDRNCHKSVVHALIMTGAIPIYLHPSRNALGIIGPIPPSEFSRAALAAKVAASPLARGREPRFRLAVVTNSTYDGLCYDVRRIRRALDASVEVLHFDEAWYAYAAFHEFYAGRHAMGAAPGAHAPLLVATQSTHKLLAAFSQASMIHVQEGAARRLDVSRFNEAFMMHTSTSPQYGILASLDVASAMMEGPAGRSLLQECFDEALAFRRAMADLRDSLPAADWWFAIWQPPGGAAQRPAAAVDWVLAPQATWHGFAGLDEDFALLDPLKVTLVMPGLEADGCCAAEGIPAAVVACFLHERGVVVEKTGLYSLLVLFSLGITKGKWSTLLTELLEFKRLFDGNAPLAQVLPSIVGADPRRYAGMGLRDLCQQLHAAYRQHGMAEALRRIYAVQPEVVLKPADAYDCLVRGEVEAVPLEQLEGRIAGVMLVPYPPGIPLLMPGERFARGSRPLIDYLAFTMHLAQQFPGFAAEVHGLQRAAGGCTVDCLRRR